MRLLRRKETPDNRGRQGPAAPSRGSVFSYYASRSTDTTSTGRGGQVAQTAKPWWHLLPSLLAAGALLVSLGYILRLDSNPKISLASQRGPRLRTTLAYQQAAQKILQRSFFNHNKLTIDTGSVERALKLQFPELSEASVTLPLVGHRPVIELAIVPPALLMSNGTETFVITGNGKAIAQDVNADSSILRNLPLIIDNSGLSIRSGQTILPTAQVSFIQALSAQLKAQGQPIASLTLPAVPNEVDVRIKGLDYFIKCNTALNARQQVGTFLAAQQKLRSDHITPGQYMDVRVEEKVFYK